MTIHGRVRTWSEEDEDETNRNLNLHQVRHAHSVGETNETDERFLETLQSSDHCHRPFGSGRQFAFDVVAAAVLLLHVGGGVVAGNVVAGFNLKFKGGNLLFYLSTCFTVQISFKTKSKCLSFWRV